METVIVGNPGREFTDTPRTLTGDERALILRLIREDGLLEAIKMYRELTDATLKAAKRDVELLKRISSDAS